jgi:hypothetical protein
MSAVDIFYVCLVVLLVVAAIFARRDIRRDTEQDASRAGLDDNISTARSLGSILPFFFVIAPALMLGYYFFGGKFSESFIMVVIASISGIGLTYVVMPTSKRGK